MAVIQDKQNKRSKAKENLVSDGEAPHEGERLSDKAYRAILHGLFSKSIPAGAYVSQNELVNLLGIPIQPMRDALRVLEAEGVLTVHPRSGIEFLKPDLEFARSTYQFRSVIERAAARRFAETGKAEEIEAMIADHKKMIARIEKNGITEADMQKMEELENTLHGGMIANMHNPLIETAAKRLKNYVTLIRIDRAISPPLALKTLHEHLAILEACAEHDGEKAEAALSAHFQAALQRQLGMF